MPTRPRGADHAGPASASVSAAANLPISRILSLGALAILALLLFRRACRLPFDYDEIAEFHSVWQVAQGRAPGIDFNHDHPPYFAELCAPLLRRLPETFESLLLMRLIDLSFSACALALLMLLLQKRFADPAGKLCAAAAVMIAASLPPVLRTLAQFRADHLVLCLALCGLLLLDAEPRERRRRLWAAAGACFAAGLLLTPKLGLLYAAAASLYGLEEFRRDRRAAIALVSALLGGAAAAAAVLNIWSLAAGIDPFPVLAAAVRHQMMANSAMSSHFLMLQHFRFSYPAKALLLFLALSGTAAVLLEIRREGLSANEMPLALLIFALGQPLWVNYVWAQYVYTPLLAWSAPLSLALRRLSRLRPRSLQGALLLLGCGLLIGGATAPQGLLAGGQEEGDLNEQIERGDQLLQWVPPGYPVASQPPLHPVFRPNSTYFFSAINIKRTLQSEENATEELMSGDPRLRGLFSAEGYLRQFQARPPALILIDGRYVGRQYAAALNYFIQTHRRDYTLQYLFGAPLLIRTRLPRRGDLESAPFIAPAASVDSRR